MGRGRGEKGRRGEGEEVPTSLEAAHTAGWRLSGEWRCDESANALAQGERLCVWRGGTRHGSSPGVGERVCEEVST